MKYIKDLLLTDTFLIKGHLNTGGQRLSTYLNSTPRSFLEVEKAILVNHVQREDAETARILVRVDEIMLAHEMETTGDESLRLLAEPEKDLLAIAAHTGGMTPLKLSGKVSRRAIERDKGSHRPRVTQGERFRFGRLPTHTETGGGLGGRSQN